MAENLAIGGLVHEFNDQWWKIAPASSQAESSTGSGWSHKASSILPSSGNCSPVISSSSVVFPEPAGPMTTP